MFVAFVALLLLLSVAMAGGRLSALAGIRLRGMSLIFTALALQIVLTSVRNGPHALFVGLHLATYAMAAYALWLNRRLPGLALIGFGGLMNGVVIALNGGTLPASATALAASGMARDPSEFSNSGIVHHPVLAQLGDVLVTPTWLPFRNVISLGDIILLIGTAVLLHTVCGSWLSPSRWANRTSKSQQESEAAVQES